MSRWSPRMRSTTTTEDGDGGRDAKERKRGRERRRSRRMRNGQASRHLLLAALSSSLFRFSSPSPSAFTPSFSSSLFLLLAPRRSRVRRASLESEVTLERDDDATTTAGLKGERMFFAVTRFFSGRNRGTDCEIFLSFSRSVGADTN